MNNIYVDELPNRCDSCVCYGGASGRCKLLHKPAFITPPKDCPLKLLSTRLAEERKKVVQELKQKFEDTPCLKNELTNKLKNEIDVILDKVERCDN